MKETRKNKERGMRSLSLFFRGSTPRMRAVMVLSALLALLLIGYAVYGIVGLFREEAPTVNRENTLFAHVTRDYIEKIEMFPAESAPYSVERYVYESNGQTLAGFKLFIDGKDYSILTIDSTALSSLIVGAGYCYVYDTVVKVPEASAPDYAEKKALYEQKLIEYKLTEDAPHFVLTTVAHKDEAGNDVPAMTYRVYFGAKSPTASSYYMRLEGKEEICIASGSTMGSLLYETGAEAIVSPTLLWKTQLNDKMYIPEQTYVYSNLFRITNFTRYKREDHPGMITGASDTVGVTLRNEDGSLTQTSYSLSSATLPSVFAEKLAGQPLGLCEIGFEATFEIEKDGKKETVTYTYDVVSIDYIERGEKLIESRYLDFSERPITAPYGIYRFTMDSLAHYRADSDEIQIALENVWKLTGSVVKIGIDEKALTEYGLYRHVVEMNYPCFDPKNMYVKDKNGKDTQDIAPTDYLLGYLYISDETERGTRYVATLTYDMIVEVDAASLDFLDYELVEWIEKDLLKSAIGDVSSISFDWNYGNGKWMNSGYRFDITLGTATNYDGSTYETIASVLASLIEGEGAAQLNIDPKIYNQLYYRMLFLRFAGGHDLSDEEVSALLGDKSACVLQINLYYKDGNMVSYRFIPISTDRVLVGVGGLGGNSMTGHFVMYTSLLKDLARGYISVMEGESFHHADRY